MYLSQIIWYIWCGRQTIRVHHTAEAPKQYWRISLYYTFLDHLITELESRLLTTENRFHAQQLLSRAVDKITNDYVASKYEAYYADIDLSLEDSRREVARRRTSWAITKRNDLSTLCTRASKRNLARRNNTALWPEDRLWNFSQNCGFELKIQKK